MRSGTASIPPAQALRCEWETAPAPVGFTVFGLPTYIATSSLTAGDLLIGLSGFAFIMPNGTNPGDSLIAWDATSTAN